MLRMVRGDDEMLYANASIGSDVTLMWNIPSHLSASTTALMEIPLSIFYEVKDNIALGITDCNDVKDLGGQEIKIATNISGKLEERDQHTDKGINVTFTGNFNTGKYQWTVHGIKNIHLQKVYLLCLRAKDRQLATVVGYARIIIKDQSTTEPPTEPPTGRTITGPTTGPTSGSTKTTQADKRQYHLSTGEIIGIVLGCLFGLALLVAACMCVYKKYKKGKDAKKCEDPDDETNGNLPCEDPEPKNTGINGNAIQLEHVFNKV